MSIVNSEYIKQFISNNQYIFVNAKGEEEIGYTRVPYSWTHGATEKHIGDGMLVYSIIQLMRYKTLVCLGSGGGFIPRIMTQARIDLHEQGIFEGNPDYNHGDIGVTYLVDACNGVGGVVNYTEDNNFFTNVFHPRFIKDTTENAYYNFFVKQDIKIDFLHIDAGHSYEDVKRDFELYTNILSENAIVSIHDTDERYQEEFIVTEDEKEYFQTWDGPSRFIKDISSEWKQFNFFNTGQVKNKPSSTGITLLQRA